LRDTSKEAKGVAAKKNNGGLVAPWLDGPGSPARKLESMVAELHQAGTLDLSMLTLAEQKLRQLSGE